MKQISLVLIILSFAFVSCKESDIPEQITNGSNNPYLRISETGFEVEAKSGFVDVPIESNSHKFKIAHVR